MNLFAGKAVLVTGGSRGIGREACLAFAREGASVAYCYRRGVEPAASLDIELEALGVPHRSYCCAVQDYSAVSSMIGDIHEGFGGIDVLVNNAGVLVVGAFVGMRHKDYRDMVETNLHGLFNVSKLSLPYLMKKKNGVVVNVSSSMAYRPMGVDQAVYAATEAGIIGFTRSMAHECAALGVRVNAIAPGLVDTGMIQDLGAPAIEGLIAKIGNARIASPNEVASLVVFLATPQASLISGQTLVADSGSVSFQF